MQSLVQKAPVSYQDNFLSIDEANELFKELDSINIQRHTYQGMNLGRGTAVFGDDVSKVPPQIWGDDAKIMEWTPLMKKVLNKVKTKLNQEFNVCLVNSYESGKDYIGWHSDNEERGSTYLIASISLGEIRRFSFMYKAKEFGGKEERLNIELDHGSLLVMKHPCQDMYLHSLPKMKGNVGKRINLTFRVFHYNNENETSD